MSTLAPIKDKEYIRSEDAPDEGTIEPSEPESPDKAEDK
jgi:hypothetical protein